MRNLISHFVGKNRLRVFKNKMLKKILGLKRYEEQRGRKKLNNGELRDVQSPQNIIRVIKSSRIKFMCNVTRLKENENSQRRKSEAMRGFGKFESRWNERTEGYRMGTCGLERLAWDWDKRRTLARGN